MTFAEFKELNRGANGMVLSRAESEQRAAARIAYKAAFGCRIGSDAAYLTLADQASEYANYQIARQRGWAHLSV